MAKQPAQDLAHRWSEKARAALVGRTIIDAFYMDAREAEMMGWTHRAVVLCLDNGLQIIPQMDDEGNDGGALSCAMPEARPFLLPVV